jgi:hypothetical protein
MLSSDRKREEFIKCPRIKVLCFTNLDVLKNIDGVIA